MRQHIVDLEGGLLNAERPSVISPTGGAEATMPSTRSSGDLYGHTPPTRNASLVRRNSGTRQPTLINDSSAGALAPSFAGSATATKRSLGIIGMLAFTFVSTSAGPFGIEGMVKASGPFTAVGFVLGVPIVLVVPIVLMVTELCSWMPSNHGSVRWVHRAFGPFAGFVNGIFQLVMNFIDLSVYPVMSTNYLCRAFYPHAPRGQRIAMQAGIALAGGLPCMLNIKGVVVFCGVASIGILLPFIVGFFGGLKDIDFTAWEDRMNPDPNVATLLSTGLWLFNGFLGNSAMGGEVTSPKVFLYGQLGALFLDVVMYVLPLLVTLQVVGSWDDAYLVTAFDHVWPGLGLYVSLAGAVSGYGLYLSSMACYSRTLWGAADLHWVPSIFAKLHGGVPRIAVGTMLLVSIALGSIGGFSFLIDLEFVIASVIYVLFAAAFVTLRYQYPNETRPYIAPGGKLVAWLLPLPLFVFMSGMVGCSLVHWANVVGIVTTTIITALLYRFVYLPAERARAKKEFYAANPDASIGID